MATIYQICESKASAGAESWLNFVDLGISSPVFEFMLASTDTCTLTVTGASAFTDAASSIFAYKKILRVGRIVDGGTRELLFLGRVERDPERGIDGTSEAYSVSLLGMWDWFDKTPMRQDWNETAGTISKPRAILFCGPAGLRMTTGQQIAQCVAVAREAGCPVAVPGAGDIITGFTPPFDEQPNIMVAQAVVKCLVNHPHVALWFDYSTREPRMYAKERTALTAVSLSVAGRRDIRISPRNDQVPPCIALCFEKSVTVDGASSLTTTIDHAPKIPYENESQTALRLKQVDAIWGVYTLDGSNATFRQQKIVVVPGYTDIMETVAWWKEKLPWLRAYATGDITLSNATMEATQSLPSILKEGTVQPWMRKQFERQRFVVDAKLSRTVNGQVTDVGQKQLSVELPMTDAISKTYRQQTGFDPGEPIPTGVADALWAEFNQLHYDGSLSDIAQEPPFVLMPGKVLNLTSGLAPWATMAAMINRVTIDLDHGTTSIQFGIPAWIDLDTRVAWYRNCNSRQSAWSRIERDPPPEESADDGGEGFPDIRDGLTPGENHRKRFVPEGDAVPHIIDLNPADITGDTAREMKPREITVVETSTLPGPLGATGDTLVRKKYQIMATDGYDPQPVDLPAGGELPDIDVITSVKGFGVTQRSGGHVIYLNFGTTNLKTGEAGADDENDLALTPATLIGNVSYGATAFSQTQKVIQTLGVADGLTDNIVTLVSHASQHVSE